MPYPSHTQCKVSEDYAKAYIKTEDVDDGKK